MFGCWQIRLQHPGSLKAIRAGPHVPEGIPRFKMLLVTSNPATAFANPDIANLQKAFTF